MSNVSHKPKLTDSQLVILSAAAGRDDRALLPLPSCLNLNKGAAAMVLESLIRKEFAAETIASLDDELWRQDDSGNPLTLIITDQGLAALGINDADTTQDQADDDVARNNTPALHSPDSTASAQDANHQPANSSKSSSAIKPGSKQALVVTMIVRQEGATIDDLMAATGWLPHTVRSALSSLRKRDIAVTNDRTGGITRYRAAAQ